jgi:cytochrome c oxidase subunit 2
MASRGSLSASGALLAMGCDGPQSTLAPAGRAAERIADLFWLMTVAAVLIWLAVLALAAWATYANPPSQGRRQVRALVIGGGVVFPTVLLTALLIHGLTMLPDLLEPAPEGSLQIEVVGEQWWWRVRYLPPGSSPIELANEIRLPLGRPVGFQLESPDVVHSFWIPALAGKMDMIPGRVTRLPLEPTRTGTFRGACAEFCGLSHARMHLTAVTLAPTDFEAWLDAQRQPAAAPVTEPARRGHAAFFAQGCGACHTVRGTTAVGWIGPDLTHLASRPTIAGAMLPNSAEARRQWISRTHLMKPGAHMPAFAHLPEQTLDDLTAYLGELR